MSGLILATHEEGEAILLEAKNWSVACRYLFNNARTAAVGAVAEYIANQRGLTLYAERVK